MSKNTFPPIRLFIGTKQVTKAQLSEHLKKQCPAATEQKKIKTA